MIARVLDRVESSRYVIISYYDSKINHGTGYSFRLTCLIKQVKFLMH